MNWFLTRLLFCALLATASCTTYQPTGEPGTWRSGDGQPTEDQEEVEFERPAPDLSLRRPPAPAAYLLQVGDILVVDIRSTTPIREENLLVGPDGEISLPLIGALRAEGRTLKELREDLQTLFAPFFEEFRVSARLTQYRRPTCTILGQVNRPGSIEVEGQLTLVDAIGKAEGFRHSIDKEALGVADLSGAFVARNRTLVPVDFEALFHRGDLAENISVYPGDFIYIPDLAQQEVFVIGYVRRPGPVPVRKNSMTVLQALANAGGPEDLAQLKNLAVVRNITKDPLIRIVDVEGLLSGKMADFPLRSGDVIYVPRDDLRALRLDQVLASTSNALLIGHLAN
ncbi:MAG TPA: SLBB domain-containing protein [Planctomycetota bacterium]|jgi:polysaccharide export outer membrane protein|nr:SLBB domain-containing protein [Planctomycetota bacterium]